MNKRMKKRLSWLLSFSILGTSIGIWSNGGIQAEADGEVPVIKITKEGVNGTSIKYPSTEFNESDILYLVGTDSNGQALAQQGTEAFGLVKKAQQAPVQWKAVVKTSDQFEVVDWGSYSALNVTAGEKFSSAIKVKGFKENNYEYISAILIPKNGGDVVAYGVIDRIDPASNDMEIGITVPVGVSDGEYMLHLYAEEEGTYLATNFQSKEIIVGEAAAEATPTASPAASADSTASTEPSVSPEPTATAVVTPRPAVSTVPVPPVTTAPTLPPVQSVAPTAVPTVIPTKQPVQPTQAPTPVPTVTPTVRPTPVVATAVPTKQPTLVPVPSNTPAIASSRPVQTLAPVPSNKPAVNTTNSPASTLAPVPSNKPAVATQPTEAPAEATEPAQPTDGDNQTPEPGSTVEQENATYKVTESGGVALDKIEVSQNQKEMTIPDTVMVNGQECKVDTISAGAFAGNKKIEQVTLGKNIKNIEKKAFSGCKNLKQVTLSNKVTTVGAESFSGCTSLKKVTLPDSVKTIGAKAFKGCKSLKNVKLGKKAGKVKGGAVSAVPYIRTSKNGVVAVETVPTYSAGSSPALTIGNYAFAACSSLKKVIINSAVRVIGSSAFRGCKKLSDITVNSQILEKVRKLALKGINNCTITVPTNKFKPYRTLFRNKGQGKKVLIAKA